MGGPGKSLAAAGRALRRAIAARLWECGASRMHARRLLLATGYMLCMLVLTGQVWDALGRRFGCPRPPSLYILDLVQSRNLLSGDISRIRGIRVYWSSRHGCSGFVDAERDSVVRLDASATLLRAK